MAKTGEKVYLVVEVGYQIQPHLDAHWPVAVFSTKENALEECKIRAEIKVEESTDFDEHCKMKATYRIKENKGLWPGYIVYRTFSKAKKPQRTGFQVETYRMNRSDGRGF